MRWSWPSRLTFDQRPLYGATAPAPRPAQFGHEEKLRRAAQSRPLSGDQTLCGDAGESSRSHAQYIERLCRTQRRNRQADSVATFGQPAIYPAATRP